MRKILRITCIVTAFITTGFSTDAQKKNQQQTIRMAAGPKFQKSSGYQSMWGTNYRKEWTTPVDFTIANFDTMYGGLTPYKLGGGHQSKSLRFKTKDGKKYAMRSVNKTLRVIMPEIFKNTWIETLADDEISMSHPYAALTVPPMAEAAGIFHTYPVYIYVPKQAALDTFQQFGDQLYLMEQRPDDDWSNAPNLGGFSKFYNSDEVREKMLEDNKKEVDQLAFVKARMFDMLIGDWDRHEEQWKWGKVEKNNRTVYIPIPVDRDQAYAKYNGFLLKLVTGAAGMKYFQPFSDDIPYPEGYSYERRNVDRYFTNHVTLAQWLDAAKQIENSVTDAAIERGIHQLPPEIFAISGEDIIAKLKIRRTHLQEYAKRYYLFLSKTVDITGSKDREHFVVNRLENGKTEVKIYDMKDGVRRDKPYFTRVVDPAETKEVRLYGISGKDVYQVDGKASNDVKIRIIAGDDRDSVVLNGYGKKVHIYDDKNENIFITNSSARKHLSKDSAVHLFDYDAFRPDKKGIKPAIGYNDEDRLFVGLAYTAVKQAFRKTPYAYKQTIGANYSISQKAPSFNYTGIFPQFTGKWDLLVKGTYDLVRWNNFFGLGNETNNLLDSNNYFQLRTKQGQGKIGLNRVVGMSNFTIAAEYTNLAILNDPGRYYAKTFSLSHAREFKYDQFIRGGLQYNITAVNDSVVPERGVIFTAAAGYTRNLQNDKKSFGDFGGKVEFFVPLVRTISLAVSAGGETITGGTPEFFQYPTIGGGNNMRGYKRDRFSGKSAFYNSNELRFITNLRTHLINGKAGLVAFYDNGRVWMPGEKSDTWHTAYGGGILFAPFNVMLFDVTYGISKEDKLIQLRIRKKL